MRAVIFPYTAYRGTPAPIIRLQARGRQAWKHVLAYVDSGAVVSIFGEAEAHVLGLDPAQGQLTHSMVGDGSLIPVYLHQLPLRIGPMEFMARIGFSPRLGVGFNLLGRQDIFTRFDVTFSDTKQTVTFHPRPR